MNACVFNIIIICIQNIFLLTDDMNTGFSHDVPDELSEPEIDCCSLSPQVYFKTFGCRLTVFVHLPQIS